MRKAILILCALPILAGCSRPHDLLDDITPGTLVSVTTKAGASFTGRVTETRPDALVLQPADAPAATVRRDQISTLTITTGQPARTEASAPTPTGGSGARSPEPGSATGTPPAATTVQQAAPAAQGVAAPDETGGRVAGSSRAAGGAAAAAAAPTWREVTIPAGTRLSLRLEESLASNTSRAEQPVRATLTQPVVVGGVTAIPVGSEVAGTVTEAVQSGRVKGRAQLGMRFDGLRVRGNDERYRIRTGLVLRRAPGTKKKDALEIGAPAIGGAVIGGLLGGKKGALVGTTVGGGAGTAVVLRTRGKEIRLPRGTRLAIKLLEPVTVRIPA